MRGVFFDQRVATVARSPYRADVALFVGFVDRRRRKHAGGAPDDNRLVDTIVPRDGRGPNVALYRWLVAESWARGDEETDRAAGLDELLNVPVPIGSFEEFDRLFAWDRRPLGGERANEVCDTYLGAAVRSFFAQGGRLCYVVRADNPTIVPLTAAEAESLTSDRAERIEKLVPPDPDPSSDRRHWAGVWVLFGLPDVSFLALPDLPDLVRAPIGADQGLPPPKPVDVGFVECSDPSGRSIDDQRVRELLAPRCTDGGYALWSRTLQRLLLEIHEMRAEGGLREVQVVAAVPRPADDRVASDLLRYLVRDNPTKLSVELEKGGLATAFLQLVYPWIGTTASDRLPEGIEPADGALCGALAANALERGTYRSIGARRLLDVVETEPPLAMRDVIDPSNTDTLTGRVTLIGRMPGGYEVLSDVTTSLEPTWRLGHANRLMAALVRALRLIGESVAFDPSNERTWARVRARASDILRTFWSAGALRGDSEADAYDVRCDRTTMSQDDIDNGRLVAMITVNVGVSIQRLDVTLTRTGGRITAEHAA